MNSDFVQQQAEHLAELVADEPTTEAKIQKAYRLALGRAATADEVRLGVEYLGQEPMKSYEERKAAAEEKKKEKDAKKDGDKTAAPPESKDTPDMPSMDPNGMMAGVVPRGRAEAAAKPPLPVTTWGRYVKVLLSSTEFDFIN